MNQRIIFDWKLLWPNLSELLHGNISSTEGFSALIVLTLWIIFLGYTGIVIWRARQTFQVIQFFNHLIQSVTPDSISSKRRDILNKAMKSNSDLAQIWIEFDKSLVESADGKRLYNTLEASHFFNTYTLSSSITENRLLAAVPGFLTAIGVIGTFAGLQLGLSGLDLSDKGMKAASGEINRLISSAAVAFLTSVWGVLTSVVFNFIEKFMERTIRTRIAMLQRQIDRLFPRNNAEQSLIMIESHQKESREALQGLAEQIGTRMQEALNQVSEGVQGGIREIMAPAIEQFVIAANDVTKRQVKGSEDVLATILDKFMEGVSQESSSQRLLTEKLNSDLNTAIDQLITQLNTYTDKTSKTEEKRFQTLMETVETMTQKQTATITFAVNETEKSAEQFTKQVENQFERMTREEEKRISLLNEQLRSMRESLQLFMTSVNRSTEQNISASQQIIDQGQILSESVLRTQKSMDQVSKRIEKSSEHLDQAASKLESLSQSLESVIHMFSDSLIETSKSSTRLTEENANLASQMNDALLLIQTIKDDIIRTTELLKNAAEHVGEGIHRFSDHHESFENTLKDHISELEKQVAKLLSDYGEQVQQQTHDRLNEWNRQTLDFSTTMRDAIYTISDVVNEIEDQLSKARN